MIGARSLSLERIIRAVLYLILGTACLGLVVSGKIAIFLHPRMSPWIAASGAVFLALCALEIRKARISPHSPLPVLSYYALLLVIVVVMQFPRSWPCFAPVASTCHRKEIASWTNILRCRRPR